MELVLPNRKKWLSALALALDTGFLWPYQPQVHINVNIFIEPIIQAAKLLQEPHHYWWSLVHSGGTRLQQEIQTLRWVELSCFTGKTPGSTTSKVKGLLKIGLVSRVRASQRLWSSTRFVVYVSWVGPVYLVIFSCWGGPVPYLELFWVGPVKKTTL